MEINDIEIKEIRDLFLDIINSDYYQELKKYIAHSNVTVYEHSINVALKSYSIALKSHFRIDYKSLIVGALFHDFYLYDWHSRNNRPYKGLHGINHPIVSLMNTDQIRELNEIERNIIVSHMFPLTILHYPIYKEAFIVCLADKLVASREVMKKDKV